MGERGGLSGGGALLGELGDAADGHVLAADHRDGLLAPRGEPDGRDLPGHGGAVTGKITAVRLATGDQEAVAVIGGKDVPVGRITEFAQ